MLTVNPRETRVQSIKMYTYFLFFIKDTVCFIAEPKFTGWHHIPLWHIKVIQKTLWWGSDDFPNISWIFSFACPPYTWDSSCIRQLAILCYLFPILVSKLFHRPKVGSLNLVNENTGNKVKIECHINNDYKFLVYVPSIAWAILIQKFYSSFIWNSNLTGSPGFYLAILRKPFKTWLFFQKAFPRALLLPCHHSTLLEPLI